MKLTAREVKKLLRKKGDPEKAKFLMRFFKTGKGQYAEGDVLLGITVPEQRLIANKYRELPLKELSLLLQDKFHECRLTALFILVRKYERTLKQEQKQLMDFYLKHRKFVNNWDLVDSSARQIVGDYLLNRADRSLLYRYAESKNIWERRIAIIATHAFIMAHQFEDTLKISEMLLQDKHDLIHKAVGWMLREMGKRDEQTLENFLKKHCRVMPRTALRYALERLSPAKKKTYMAR